MRSRREGLREESNLDIEHLWRQIWRSKYFIILSGTLFLIIATLVSMFLLTPKYKSVTKMYIVNQNNTTNTVTTQDLQLGNLLIKDYREIILSNGVLESVAKDLGLSTGAVRRSLSIVAPNDNRILSIISTNKNAELSSSIANKVREKSIEKIKEIAKVKDISTIDEAKTPTAPYTPNVKRNAVFGFLFGLILAFVFVLGREFLDDRIKSPEDIEIYIDRTLLGVIPKNNHKRKKNGSN